MTVTVAVALAIALAQPQAPEPVAPSGSPRSAYTATTRRLMPRCCVWPRSRSASRLPTDTLDHIRKVLEDSGRFRSVDVRKRYASLSDTSAVLLVIVVEERAGIAIDVPDPGPMRTLRANTMWMPILRSEDGYGLTYGARVSLVDVLGRRTRLSAPFSWGGERRATVEIERRFERGPLTRVIATGGITRREHPTLDIGDRRTGVGIRAERALTSWLQVAGGGGVSDIRFGDRTTG